MMTLELLKDLHARDIHLECVGGKLHVDAPKGAVTPEIRIALLEQKASLLALLSEGALQSLETDHYESAQEEDAIPTQCCVCGADVECYSEQREAYCEIHWRERINHAPTLASVQEIYALSSQWDAVSPAQLVLDLETTGLDPRKNKVITIAVGTPEKVTIIDVRGYYRADPSYQQVWKEALQHLLQRETMLWIGHNLKFDWSFLAHQFGVRLKQVYDTMLVEKLLHAGGHVSASLLASAARYGVTVTKEHRSWFIDLDTRPSEWIASFPEEQLIYIQQDISVPYQLYEQQQKGIVEQDLARVVSLEQQALPAIAAIEVHGAYVDVERWRGILAARHEQKRELEGYIQQMMGEALASTRPTGCATR